METPQTAELVAVMEILTQLKATMEKQKKSMEIQYSNQTIL